jgi:hypothetical protein
MSSYSILLSKREGQREGGGKREREREKKKKKRRGTDRGTSTPPYRSLKQMVVILALMIYKSTVIL